MTIDSSINDKYVPIHHSKKSAFSSFRNATRQQEAVQETKEEDDDDEVKEDISTIFNPNFTTKKEGNFGLGIGLSISQQIVSTHQGFILVESEVGSHTNMQVWLPFKQEGAPHE